MGSSFSFLVLDELNDSGIKDVQHRGAERVPVMVK